MDDLDRALFEAWGRAKRSDSEADEIAEKPTYIRPLRSFALLGKYCCAIDMPNPMVSFPAG